MYRSRLLPLVLAVLLLGAGCATDPGTDAAPTGDGTTVAPTEVGAASAPTYPSGVTASGVDAAAVAANHRAALNDTSFTLSLSVEQSLGNRSVRASSASRVGADRENVSIRTDAPSARNWIFLTGDTQYGRIEAGNRTRYDVRERTGDADRSLLNSSAGASLIDETLSLGNYSVAGAEERDGTTFTTLRATGIAADAERPELANVVRFDSTVVVDGDGVVRSVAYTMVLERDGRSVTTTLSLDVSDVGSTTVTAPDWIDEAEAAA